MRSYALCLVVLFGCSPRYKGTGTNAGSTLKPAPAAASRKTNEPPSACRPFIMPRHCNGPDNFPPHNDVYLEGAGLETIHFASDVFPPPAGTTLTSVAACPGNGAPDVSVKILACHGDAPTDRATCSVQVISGPDICGTTNDDGQRPQAKVTIVRGSWDGKGSWAANAGSITLACDMGTRTSVRPSDGAIATCLNGGYQPGSDLFLACIRALRADYCGDGTPHTVAGTVVDMHDSAVNKATAATCADGMTLEAAWSPGGAVCVTHQRWAGLISKVTCVPPLPECGGDKGVGTELLFTRSHCNKCRPAGNPAVKCPETDSDPACQSSKAAKH